MTHAKQIGMTLCWLLLSGLAAAMSAPIWAGWQHDAALRFGEYCFILWVLAVVPHWRIFPKHWSAIHIGFAVVAGILLFLGLLGELQALVYCAFAVYFCLPVGTSVMRACLLLPAVFWMPAWAWLSTPLFGTVTAPVSLGVSGTVTLVSYYKLYSNFSK